MWQRYYKKYTASEGKPYLAVFFVSALIHYNSQEKEGST